MAKKRRREREPTPPTSTFSLRSCVVGCLGCALATVAGLGTFFLGGFTFNVVLEMTPPLESEKLPAAAPLAAPAAVEAAPPAEAVPAAAAEAQAPEPLATALAPTAAPETTPPPVRTAAAMAALPKCRKVAFLRIQKTASTTFGQDIMAKMCAAAKQTCGISWDRCARGNKKCNLPFSYYHLESRYTHDFVARDPPGRGCVTTFLRDPVERTLSEFFMLREKHRQFISFDQWDIHANDLAALDDILNIKDVSESFQKYLHFPGNPSRNRQALYLLGFQRVKCNQTRCGGDACICEEDDAGYPAKAYDWEANSEELLEKAKQKLLQLDGFGITDCFIESVEVLAPLLGWNAKEAVKIAKESHAMHVWKPTMQKASKIKSSLEATGRRLAGTRSSERRLSFNGPGSNFWREFISPDVRKDILDVNSIDDELVRFARDTFFEMHGKECEDKA